MCAKFHAFHKDSGFQYLESGRVLVVPEAGIGLVLLCNVPKSFTVGNLKYDRRLTVESVSIAEIGKYLAEYLRTFPASLHDAYRTSSPFLLQQLSHGCVLLAVRTRTRGLTSIEYPDRRNPTRLNVYTMPSRGVPISFRYVSFLDKNGAMNGGTKRIPSEAKELVDFLNRLFFPRANVEFELRTAERITIQEKFGDSVDGEFFKKRLIPKRDTSAEVTVFFAGKYQYSQGAPAEGTAVNEDGAVIVSDFPVRKHSRSPETTFPSRRPNYDQTENAKHPGSTDRDMQYTLAHEVTHVIAAYDGHNTERGDLMSEPPSVLQPGAEPWLDDFNLGLSVLRGIERNS